MPVEGCVTGREREFVRDWNQGVSPEILAVEFGIAVSTVPGVASKLRRRGFWLAIRHRGWEQRKQEALQVRAG